MGLADLFRPKYRHSDIRVRTEAVRALSADDITILTHVAKTDREASVRRIALEKIDEADVLADLAAAESERSLRDLAGARAAELWQATACSDDADAATTALSGIIKLGDQRALVDIAVRAQLPVNRKRAFGELREPRALAELAKSDAAQDVRAAAVARIDDSDVLRGLAIDTTHKEVGLAAVEKIDDAEKLETIAQKAKNKAVRQRARRIVAEMAEAEAKARPTVPDEVKRRRAEQTQLVREVEGLAESFEFARVAEIMAAAKEQWDVIGHDAEAELGARFSKALHRFGKRRELHEQQARSADELRAVEREAAEAKQRAAAEREAAAAASAGATASVEQAAPADDPIRAAREAEAKARREERDRERTERDAARAADQAAREARKKEDAERAVAIAESLRAMCADLEALAAASTRDGKAIDRALQQAAKAFEQLGKLTGGERDALADRYSAVRGKLVVRASELREAQDWERFANVPKAEALIATAKEMLGEEPSPDLGHRLRGLQALWKEVGPMPQKRSKELWDQFKQACDAVYDKVRGFRAVEAEKFGEVEKLKEALIAEAEALIESTEWQETSVKLKALQTRWKESGHLPRKQGDALWKRFRAACDAFFERRKPMLDAERAAEEQNLAAKQELIDRAKRIVAGPETQWGRAIGQVKDLQQAWRTIGFVPRREVERVSREFRAACDAVFAARDAARDGEANAQRVEIEALRVEITAIVDGKAGNDVVARAVAARSKARDLDALAAEVEAMILHVVTTHRDAVVATELDPAAARGRRAKLIARAEQLVPKQAAPAAVSAADVATQLKQAMSRNAFGDLRWDGREAAEVVAELREEWRLAGPILDDADRAQAQQFDAVIARVLHGPAAVPAPTAAPVVTSHPDAETQPVRPEPLSARAPLPPPPEPVRAKSSTAPPLLDDVDSAWDLGDDDPTASAAPEPAPGSTTPSASELAGDGATGGDGVTDDQGWD